MNIAAAISFALTTGKQSATYQDQWHQTAEAAYLSQFIDSILEYPSRFYSELMTPIDLHTFLQTGRAGLLRFQREELVKLWEPAESTNAPIGEAWFEASAVGDDWNELIAYPQTAKPSPEVSVWLPVREGEVTHLVPLDLGINFSEIANSSPMKTVSGFTCHPGYTGDQRLRQICLPATCDHPCQGIWVYQRGRDILAGCKC